MTKLIIIFLASFFTAKCLISDPPDLNLEFDKMSHESIGIKGTVVALFIPNLIDHGIMDTNKTTYFKSNISDTKKTYEVNCGLWSEKENSNNYIEIYCDIGSDIPSGEYYLLLNKTKSFNYLDKYKVNFLKCDNVKFKKLDKNVIDIYSGAQSIIIKEDQESYELKFNVVSYNQEIIFLDFDMPLENCKNENNILTCTLTKNDLLAYLAPSDKEKYITYRDDNYIPKDFPLLHKIKISIKEFQKKDIYIEITKLLTDVKEPSAPIAYETNVTEISKIYNKHNFKLTFKTKKNEEEIEDLNMKLILYILYVDLKVKEQVGWKIQHKKK